MQMWQCMLLVGVHYGLHFDPHSPVLMRSLRFKTMHKSQSITWMCTLSVDDPFPRTRSRI